MHADESLKKKLVCYHHIFDAWIIWFMALKIYLKPLRIKCRKGSYTDFGNSWE